jgi:hypothetical protein
MGTGYEDRFRSTVGSEKPWDPLSRPNSSQVLMDNTDCCSGRYPNVTPDNHAGISINARIYLDAVWF